MNSLKIITSLLMGLIGASGLAQSHQQAKQLLEEATEALKKHEQVYLSFNYDFENTRVDPPVTQHESGHIALKGDDYHLQFMDMEQIRKGNKLYTILTHG
ncbi:MAG: hypothetical protein U5L96_05080 [Owenweeksia sp.]|nr:hypothetical protein [Owenweeksia sp.]